MHLDLYRIAGAAELDFLGLDELAATARLWLVEWPERGGSALPPADLDVHLGVSGQGRVAALRGTGLSGADWLAKASKIAALPGGS